MTTLADPPLIAAIRRIVDEYQAAAICLACHTTENAGQVMEAVAPDGEDADVVPCRCGEGSLVVVDAFTASAVVKVYDALSDANRTKFVGLGLLHMVDVTWKLVR